MTFLGMPGASVHGNLRGDELPGCGARRRWPIPSCARNLGGRPPRSAPSGARWSAKCPTGRRCARPVRRSRTTSSRRSTRYLLQLEAARHRARRHGALGARRRRGEPHRRRPRPGHRGARGRQGQVDGDSGDRSQRGARGGRHRRVPRPISPSSSSSWATTSRATSWCRRSTATAVRSARSSCARWPASTRTSPTSRAVLAEAARRHLRQQVPHCRGRDQRRELRGRRRPARSPSSSPRATGGCA